MIINHLSGPSCLESASFGCISRNATWQTILVIWMVHKTNKQRANNVSNFWSHCKWVSALEQSSSNEDLPFCLIAKGPLSTNGLSHTLCLSRPLTFYTNQWGMTQKMLWIWGGKGDPGVATTADWDLFVARPVLEITVSQVTAPIHASGFSSLKQ